MTTEEGNRLIAEFMEFEHDGKWFRGLDIFIYGQPSCHEGSLKFHTSWDWLMPAWKKFSELKVNSSLTGWHAYYCGRITHELAASDIYAAHKHLSNGIQWYKQNQ